MTKRDILSDAEVEALFENKPISDIKNFNNELRKDIDKKREELRTTVGERYRDLMEAAETIIHMQTTSIEVVKSLKDIVATTSRYECYPGIVSKKCGLDRKLDDANKNIKETYEPNDMATVAQIKLLMDSPEILWLAVDNGDYLIAAQVFLFARHIHTNITFNTNSVQGKKLSTAFPIIERQWSSILPFFDAILNGCTKLMSDESICDPEHSAQNPNIRTINTTNIIRSMAAMTLLKGIKTRDLFKEFLSLREQTIKKIIFAEGTSAKSHIRSTILSVIYCIQSCCAFSPVDNTTDTIETVLRCISKQPVLSFFQNISVSPIMKYLPNIVCDFCSSTAVKGRENVSSNATPDALDKDFLTTECTNWLDRVHAMITSGTSKVLAHVNTLGGLSIIRKNTYDYLAGINSNNATSPNKTWNSICLSILQRTLNIWDEFYRNLFQERAEELVLKEIENSVVYLQSSLASLPDVESVGTAEYVWKEGNANEEILNQNESKNKKSKPLTSLELKARSYPPTVQSICQNFDDKLQSLLSQLSEYVTIGELTDSDKPCVKTSRVYNNRALEKSIGKNDSETFELDQDNDALLEFVEKSMSVSVTKMLDDLHLQVKNELPSMISDSKVNERYIIMARICQSIPELSTSLEKCLTASKYFQRNVKDSYVSNDYLNELKNLSVKSSNISNESQQKLKEINENFVHSCSFLLLSWIDIIGSKMVTLLKTKLSNSFEANLNMLSQWEAVEISEEGEDNKLIKSIIRIPCQISVGLFQVIHQFAHMIYATGSHNLPSKVQDHINHHTPLWLSRAYSGIFNAEYDANSTADVRITQNVALQLYFDVQFIMQCMTSRDNNDAITSSQQAITLIERHIDPFDLSVFSPYIATNVKRCVLKYQAIYGILIPVDRFTLLTSMKAALPQVPMSSSIQQSGGISGAAHPSECSMPLSYFTLRFPLLPIASKKSENLRIGSRQTNRNTASLPNSTNDNSSERGIYSKTKTDEVAANSGEASPKAQKREKSPVNKAWSAFEEMSNKWFGTGK